MTNTRRAPKASTKPARRNPASTGSTPSQAPPKKPPADAAHLLDALPYPLLVIGRDGEILRVNAATEHLFQSSAPVLYARTLADFLAFTSPVLALTEQVRRTGHSVNEYSVELDLPRISSRVLVDLYCGPLAETPGQLLLAIQPRNVAQMIERQLTHRAAARSVSGMAGMLAHEIKNPLSGIRGAAQLLEMGVDDDGRALTQLICDETDRINALVDRMAIFGDDRPPRLQPVNPHEILGHVRTLALSGFASHIRISENYDPSLPAIPGDRDQLIQALLNLVKNSAEAIGKERHDGHIRLHTAYRPGVRLSVPGRQKRRALPLMIEVEDNGPGIPDEVTDHIFDPFVTTKMAGSGLGLALVAKIVRDHGGTIESDSQPGRTAFRLLLPIDADRQAHISEPDAPTTGENVA